VAVDAGTGSGAIALALAAELGCADLKEIWATDASAAALEVAATNLAACRDAIVAREKGCCDGRSAFPLVKLTKGSWLTPLPERLRGSVDLVVSNPPYVTEEEWATLTPEVRAEPRGALVAGPGREGAPGLADVERVLEEGLLWLRLPGVIVVELAPHQAPAAERCALQLGYEQVRIEPDLAMRPRTLVARLGGAQGSE
jgi:release factor glutamine methyltransferase